jgi:hypothetical protein
MDWAEQQLAVLRPQYEGLWCIWFVRHLYAGTTWHARPAGTDVAAVCAPSPDELAAAIADRQTTP